MLREKKEEIQRFYKQIQCVRKICDEKESFLYINKIENENSRQKITIE